MTSQRHETEPKEETDEIHKLEHRASWAKTTVNVLGFSMLLISIVGLVLICLIAKGCFTNIKDCNPQTNNKIISDCTNNKVMSTCRLSMSNSCRELVPQNQLLELKLYKADDHSSSRDQYHVRCVDVVTKMKYQKQLVKTPNEQCINLLTIWMTFLYPKYWAISMFGSGILGLVISSLINGILILLKKNTPCPICSMVSGIIIMINTVLLLIGIEYFHESLFNCYTLPETWVASLTVGVFLAFIAYVEAIVSNYLEYLQHELVKAQGDGRLDLSESDDETLKLRSEVDKNGGKKSQMSKQKSRKGQGSIRSFIERPKSFKSKNKQDVSSRKDQSVSTKKSVKSIK